MTRQQYSKSGQTPTGLPSNSHGGSTSTRVVQSGPPEYSGRQLSWSQEQSRLAVEAANRIARNRSNFERRLTQKHGAVQANLHMLGLTLLWIGSSGSFNDKRTELRKTASFLWNDYTADVIKSKDRRSAFDVSLYYTMEFIKEMAPNGPGSFSSPSGKHFHSITSKCVTYRDWLRHVEFVLDAALRDLNQVALVQSFGGPVHLQGKRTALRTLYWAQEIIKKELARMEAHVVPT